MAEDTKLGAHTKVSSTVGAAFATLRFAAAGSLSLLDLQVLDGLLHHIWDGGPFEIDETVQEGGTVAGFRVIDQPGNAPGQIGLRRGRDRVAIVADAFYMTTIYGRRQSPALPLDAYNADTDRAKKSLEKLASLKPRIVAPGHLGPLIGDDVGATLLQVART